MRLGELTAAPTPPAGVRFRPASGEHDFHAAAELVFSGGTDGSSAYRDFFAYQYREHHAAFVRSGSTWWLAFDGAELVGSLGLYEAPGWCRYRDVETRASHRRRGLASALIATAALHARARAADRPIYMVATAGEAPERLYTRLGFRPAGALFTLMRERP
jgi:GNAT superfamily N-acetyltransferase